VSQVRIKRSVGLIHGHYARVSCLHDQKLLHTEPEYSNTLHSLIDNRRAPIHQNFIAFSVFESKHLIVYTVLNFTEILLFLPTTNA